MDQLIKDIKLHIDMYEADEDKESAAFYVNILGRIRYHETENAILHHKLAACKKDLAAIRTAVGNAVRYYDREGPSCLLELQALAYEKGSK